MALKISSRPHQDVGTKGLAFRESIHSLFRSWSNALFGDWKEGRKEEGTHGRRIVPQSGGGNGFMMPLDPEIGRSERVCEE